MYIPNPIRCRKCLRLGHFADNCLKEAICGFCSKPEHHGSPCDTFVPICVNCKEKHHSLDSKCPRLIEEKEIKTIQFREKITYGAAKKQYKVAHNITTSKNYADVARMNRKGVEVACQTDACISSSVNPKLSQPSPSSAITGITGLPPLQPLPSPPSPSSNPFPSNFLPSPQGPLPLPPTSPLASPISTPPSLPLASRSTDPKPPSLEAPEEIVELFKSPPLPKRDIKNKKTKKTGKKRNEPSEEQMDDT